MDQADIVESLYLEKIRLLKSFMPSDLVEAYKNVCKFGDKVSYDYSYFVPFCHAYAEHLLNCSSFNFYGEFIEKFNQIIQQDETYKLTKEIQTSLFIRIDILGFLKINYDKVLIKDKRYPINNGEFEKESDFENIIKSNLKECFFEEINVKTQQRHGYGISDITINDSVTIELKKSKAKRMNVYQTFEYSFDKNIKDVCLITSDFDEQTLAIARKLEVSCYTYSFMYEDESKGYPVGFVIEKVNETKRNDFDKYLDSMEEAFWISFYEPNFKFSQSLEKNMNKVTEILDLTNKIHYANSQKILEHLEKQGYDTSNGLQDVLTQIKQRKAI